MTVSIVPQRATVRRTHQGIEKCHAAKNAYKKYGPRMRLGISLGSHLSHGSQHVTTIGRSGISGMAIRRSTVLIFCGNIGLPMP
jgi:hypothetical protein